MKNLTRVALCASLGAGLVVSSSEASPEAQPLLRAQLLRLKQENRQIRDQNNSMRSDIAEMKAMMNKLLSGGANLAPATTSPPPRSFVTPPEDAVEKAVRSALATPGVEPPLTEEERRLAAEFEAELGASSASQPAKRTKVGPRTQAPWSQPRPSRNFWGVGGIAGQSNVLDLGLTSEWIGGRATERGRSEFTDTFSLRETEFSVGGFVDPYHRADMLLVWNDAEDEVAIEEGFMTFFNLPEGWRARVGKFRSRTGPVNGLHFADLPWIDYPLAHKQFLGEEGFGAAGARLTYLGEPKGKWSWSADMEVFRGDNDTLVDAQDLPGNKDAAGDFDADRFKDDIILSGHVTNHFQLDEANTFELGYSRIQADNDRVKLDGFDFTYRYMPQPGRNEWRWQTEILKQHREDLAGTGDTDRDGWYTWVDRRFNRNFAAGLRFDKVDPFTPGDPQNESKLAYFTYYPTEFSWYRLQYQEDTDGVSNITDKQVFLQFRWQLGTDRHALQ